MRIRDIHARKNRLGDVTEAVTNVGFHNEVTGFSHGQLDGILYAYDKDTPEWKVIGTLPYCVYQNEVFIKHIETTDKAPMLGVRMVKELQRQHPDIKINPGFTTDDGSRLFNLIKKRYPSDVEKNLFVYDHDNDRAEAR